MKAYLGFANTVYVFEPSLFDDVLLRVWEIDPAAQQAKDFKGRPAIKLTSGLSLDTRNQIRNQIHTVNGIHIPTADEIEADTHRMAGYTPPAAGKLIMSDQPCTAIIVYTPPVTALAVIPAA